MVPERKARAPRWPSGGRATPGRLTVSLAAWLRRIRVRGRRSGAVACASGRSAAGRRQGGGQVLGRHRLRQEVRHARQLGARRCRQDRVVVDTAEEGGVLLEPAVGFGERRGDRIEPGREVFGVAAGGDRLFADQHHVLLDPFELGVDQHLALLGALEVLEPLLLDVEGALERPPQRRLGGLLGQPFLELGGLRLERAPVDAREGLADQLARGQQAQENRRAAG